MYAILFYTGHWHKKKYKEENGSSDNKKQYWTQE